MCNESSSNIKILSENGKPLITISDSYLNDKINDFKNFLLNFNDYFILLDNVLESRLHRKIDSIALSLYNDDFLMDIDFSKFNLPIHIDLEMVLFNTFNLLYNYKNKEYVILNNDTNIVLNKNNNYYLLNLENGDGNIILFKYSNLNDFKLNDNVFIYENDLEEYIQYLLNNK